MSDATQARCPECGHNLGLDPHTAECGWGRGMPGTVLSEQAYLTGGNVRAPRYPEQPEEPRPATWFERVRRWFR